jgi:predicted DNA binding CopG/RHH family protein
MPKYPSKRPSAKPKARTKSPLKAIPHFRSEDEEREFWATADPTEYFDWTSARRVAFPNLKPSTETISLRLPQGLLDDLKVLANQRDVPYQSLLKVYLAERVAVERDAAIRSSSRASA